MNKNWPERKTITIILFISKWDRKYASLPFISIRWFWDGFKTFKCRFYWFWLNLRNFKPRKTYKTRDSVFPKRLSTKWHKQFDVEFCGESNVTKHVPVAHCTKKFFYEKPRKSRKKHDYPRIFERISAFFYISWCVLSYE